MRVFGTSRLFLLTIWVVCFLALGTTKSNCLYEEEKGEFDVAKGQDGDLMDGKEYFLIYISALYLKEQFCQEMIMREAN